MAEAKDARDRRAKWLRYTARALAFFWALSCTVAIVSFWVYMFLGYLYFLVVLLGCWIPLLGLALWGTAAIAWRRERIGGVLLVLHASLVSTWAAHNLRREFGDMGMLLVVVVGALPALVAGDLFLVAWWKSRTPTPCQME
jgi:hypothetical protein